MQHQTERVGLGLFWNEIAQQFDYLPRIVYKNCILSQARWLVRVKDIKAFFEIKEDEKLLQKVKEWQISRNIPDFVSIVDNDNKRFVDMNNMLSIRAWLSVVKNHSSFQLDELLFNPATAVVHGPEGAYTNEFIFALYKKTAVK